MKHKTAAEIKKRAAKAKEATDKIAPAIPGGSSIKKRKEKMDDRINKIWNK